MKNLLRQNAKKRNPTKLPKAKTNIILKRVKNILMINPVSGKAEKKFINFFNNNNIKGTFRFR